MRKGTIIKWCILVPVLLLGLGLLTKFVIIPLFDTSGENSERTVEIYGYTETGLTYALENDHLRFELDPATTQFVVTDKRTGKVWRSTPEGVNDDPKAKPGTVENSKLNSPLVMTYSMSTGMQTILSAYEYSVNNGVYQVELLEEENAVRVNYSIGRIKRTFRLPTAIGEARMDEFLAKMDKPKQKAVTEYFRKIDINKLRKTDNKEELLAAYPDLAEMKVYVLRDNTADYLKAEMEGYFADAGYTAEDYEYDMGRIAGQSVTATAVFNVSLVYRLEGDDLVVTMPVDRMDCLNDYPLVEIALLPAFGAGSTQDTGFMMVPDGSGAIIDFNNGKVTQSAYYANLYGWDWATIRNQVTNETHIEFPVFGVSSTGGSFVCMLEGGASWAGVNADISGRNSGFNTIYTTYKIIHGDAYDVAERTNNAVYMFEQGLPATDIVQRYRFLTDESYVAMAKTYRSYLQSMYPELTMRRQETTPVSVELVGAIDKVKQRLGVPTNVPIAMTTYKQARTIVERLVAEKIPGLTVKYSGWMNGGVNQKWLRQVRLVSELGSRQDLLELTAYAKAQGVPFYVDGLTQFAKDSGLLEGFFAMRDAARFTTREEAELWVYSTIWYGKDDFIKSYFLLKPSLTSEMMQNLVKAALEYGATGVAYRDTGSILSADYDARNHVSREESILMQVEQLKAAREQGMNIQIRRGNVYAAPYADIITDMTFDGGQYGILDRYVPFYTMALHGFVNYTGVALNLAPDQQELLLRSAENGAGLQFSFMASDATELQESWYSSYFGTDFSLVLEPSLEVYRRYEAQMSGVFGQAMTDHRQEGSVTVTTYEDGTEVYVNYGYEPATVGGVEIPARDYAVKAGGEAAR